MKMNIQPASVNGKEGAYTAVQDKSAVTRAVVQGTAPVTTQAVEPTYATPSPAQITDAMRKIQQAVQPSQAELSFSVNKESGKTVIRVVDSTTKELIRQIPSEEVLAMAESLDHQAAYLVKAKA
jgi:flagellar protein FlaG